MQETIITPTPPDLALYCFAADRRPKLGSALQEAAREHPIVFEIFIEHKKHNSPSTESHLLDVTDLIERFCTRFGVSSNRRVFLLAGAFGHDIGKTELENRFFETEGKLSDDEFALVSTHARRGYDWFMGRKGRDRKRIQANTTERIYAITDLAVLAGAHHLPGYPDPKGSDAVYVPDYLQDDVLILSVADKIAAQAVPRSYRLFPLTRAQVTVNILKDLEELKRRDVPSLVTTLLDLHPLYANQPALQPLEYAA
ncbi:MAG: hypothetical protein HY428_03040 [Candidatus Levybacteria bacterium]|nr:hypothetical protein [Candidatus Levybacteria bacterium]